MVEATGNPRAGIIHAEAAIAAGKHVIMVNVEADAIIGPLLTKKAGMNPQMFNSFLDGTKSAIEMVAITNSCDLDVPSDGLHFLPCGADDLARVLRPRDLGGQLEKRGIVETIYSLERDGRPVFHDLR